MNDPCEYVHKEGCGEVAFSIDYTPKFGGESPSASSVTFPDGTTPRMGDRIKCGSCGKGVVLAFENLRPLDDH